MDSRILSNLRIKFMSPDEMKDRQPTIPVNVPNNPLNPLSYVVVPARLQIELQDPDNDMKPAWFDIPFEWPQPPSIVEVAARTKKRN
jgi:hypothetical protein